MQGEAALAPHASHLLPVSRSHGEKHVSSLLRVNPGSFSNSPDPWSIVVNSPKCSRTLQGPADLVKAFLGWKQPDLA